MLDVRRMLLLAEVARRGSLTSAAQALTYTPSAVSQQIAKLEAEAGQPLLERNARGITLTDAGQALVRHAERIDRQLQAARAELEQRTAPAVRSLFDRPPAGLQRAIDYALRAAPTYSLRGGAREILRGITARALGVR